MDVKGIISKKIIEYKKRVTSKKDVWLYYYTTTIKKLK